MKSESTPSTPPALLPPLPTPAGLVGRIVQTPSPLVHTSEFILIDTDLILFTMSAQPRHRSWHLVGT